MVAVLGLLIGIGIGYGFGPGRGSSATPTATPGITPRVVSEAPWTLPPSELPMVTIPPTAPMETPPPGGLSIEQALTALAGTGFGGSQSVVISAAAVPYRDVADQVVGSPGDWFWVFVVYGDFGIPMIGPICTLAPATPTAVSRATAIATAAIAPSDEPCAWPFTTARVVLDYQTGEMLYADIPALGS